MVKFDANKAEIILMDPQYTRLGEILKNQGLISPSQLEWALKQHATLGVPLGQVLTREGLITEEMLAKALADQKHLDLVDLTDYDINPMAAATLREDWARRNQAIPIGFKKNKLVVALANPLDIQTIDSIQLMTGYKVLPVVATSSSIDEAIRHHVGGEARLKETVEEAAKERRAPSRESTVVEVKEDAPVVKVANNILVQAYRQRASDIHLESLAKALRVRLRVDGVMREAMSIPVHLAQPLISRYKIMSGMDIAERRRPQDGRMAYVIDGREANFRVASLPGAFGENIVLRLLSGANSLIELHGLGLDSTSINIFRKAFSRSHGSVLVTGPTGSGKTTTLYAAVNELNKPEKKIITIEDPIEYSLTGVTQMQINRKAGLDFASGLRAIVRADPDVVMIGEIRDPETAHIAIRAALTGHMVLSSLHTNDAASTLTRLVDMGVEAFLVSSSIQCVLAQRLGRLLCEHCKRPVKYNSAQLRVFRVAEDLDGAVFYEPQGCRKCSNTGYKGRIGLFELLTVTDEIARWCVKGAASTEIKRIAVSNGMQTLFKDGVVKARQGLISLAEVCRVVQ